jgi:hypothetical protein
MHDKIKKTPSSSVTIEWYGTKQSQTAFEATILELNLIAFFNPLIAYIFFSFIEWCVPTV